MRKSSLCAGLAAPRTKHIQMLIYTPQKRGGKQGIPGLSSFPFFFFLYFCRLAIPLDRGVTNRVDTGEQGAEWICLIRLLSSVVGKQNVFSSVFLSVFLCVFVSFCVTSFLWVYASV